MPTTKFVYDFAEGNRDLKELLGGKGANLAEMTNVGLPVPPGFTITTQACRGYLKSGRFPDGLGVEVTEHLEALEREMGKRSGELVNTACWRQAGNSSPSSFATRWAGFWSRTRRTMSRAVKRC